MNGNRELDNNNISKDEELDIKKSERRLPLYRIFAAAFLVLFVVASFLPSGYYIVEPGPPLSLEEIIDVEDSYRSDKWGSFYLTAVGQRRATFMDVFRFVLLPTDENKELSPVAAAIPPGMDEEEYIELMAQLMEESQLEAQAAAFNEAGIEVEIAGLGVEIIEVMEGSPARDNLEKGDIIRAVDGDKIEMATEAVDKISEKEIGRPVKLEILRNDEEIELEVPTQEHHERDGDASLGILITSAGLEYDMPEKVNFKDSDLVGPSAGVMFALEIYNQLTEDDLTRGRKIAGSGEIDHNGNISRVSGVELKVVAAAEENADLFITSRANEKEAVNRAKNYKLEVIVGDTLSDILKKLELFFDERGAEIQSLFSHGGLRI